MSLSHGSMLSERVIRLSIEVHRQLGPGLLQSAYEECLCFELGRAGIGHSRQVPLPIVYKKVRLDCGYRTDLIVQAELIVEINAVEWLLLLQDAQILTYLRLSQHRVALLLNFNNIYLRDGIRRFVL